GALLPGSCGLGLALMLTRVFALFLLVVFVRLFFVHCCWLARERRCADAERQRGTDHGGQGGTVDGFVDVHGDPRCCLRTSSSCSERTTREIHLTTSECFRPHSAAVRLPETAW